MIDTSAMGGGMGGAGARDLPPALLATPVWSDELLRTAGMDVQEVPFVTVGGGLGSLAVAQVLRLAGASAAGIRVLSDIDLPHESFRRLAERSQIRPDDRLRSASDARIDGIWGWPGYAVREAARDRRVRPLWAVLAEPVLGEYLTPRARDVYETVEKEAHRLRWSRMLSKGRVRALRRRAGGGYFLLQTTADATTVFRCTYAHLAVGYPSPRLLPDIQRYRAAHPECRRLAHAYEPHEHVYEGLCREPGTVVVRGAGIVASRILQRLLDDRTRHGARTQVIHVLRNPVTGPAGPRRFRRDGGEGFSYQPFNFPKAAFGGQLKTRLEGMEEPERLELIREMGGTSTARRRHWLQQLEEARRGGWYRQRAGTIEEISQGPSGSLVAVLRGPDGEMAEVPFDFMIDATGLEDDIRSDPLLRDVIECTGARLNGLLRLDVEPTFEVRGTRSEPGRLYASGAMTLGGHYAPVDSFLGLQYAALCIGDDLARLGFCERIGVSRSVQGWWRWLRGAAP